MHPEIEINEYSSSKKITRVVYYSSTRGSPSCHKYEVSSLQVRIITRETDCYSEWSVRCIGAKPSTTLWRSTEWRRLKSQALKVRFSGKRCSPPYQLGGQGSTVSSPSEDRGKTPATRRFRTFYRLTKRLLVLILLILKSEPQKISRPNFCQGPDLWSPRDWRLWRDDGKQLH